MDERRLRSIGQSPCSLESQRLALAHCEQKGEARKRFVEKVINTEYWTKYWRISRSYPGSNEEGALGKIIGARA